MMLYQWYGVLGPNGALEHVDESEEMAWDVVRNLSPDPKHPTHTVEPVTVVTGAIDDLVMGAVEAAKERQPGWPRAEYKKTAHK